MSAHAEPVLAIHDLTVDFYGGGSAVRAVSGLSVNIRAGETVALVGESGSGKTTMALAALGLLPSRARTAGRVRWKGRDILGLGHAEMRAVRGKGMGFIPQDPTASLHPLIRVDRQVAEALAAHDPGMGRADARDRAAELLERMGIPPERLADGGYSHQWSGGMRQRALIAMAVANRPELIIADEPTTALDAATEAAVFALLTEARRESGAALLLMTHDLAGVVEIADRIGIMRDGQIIETGSPETITRRPRVDYTRGLIAAALGSTQPRVPVGAAAITRNDGDAPPRPGRDPGTTAASEAGVGTGRTTGDTRAVLSVEDVVIRYRLRRAWARRAPDRVTAVDGVSFDVAQGESVGLIGESGAGKSTLARALVRLERPAAGRIMVGGHDINLASGAALKALRATIQIVFQEHAASLNPRRHVGASIAQPLLIHGCWPRKGGERRVAELLEQVGLPATYYGRYPHELSGGQRQRVAIARALALEPRILVLDEPVTSLDAIARTNILDLLRTLCDTRGLALVLIAHDLRFVRDLAERVAVMERGRIVEIASADQLFAAPRHACTRRLLGVPDRHGKAAATAAGEWPP